MKKSFKVNNKLIGDGKKTFIIAEIGINHQGNLETCKKMIKSAALCGADAAKIQLVDVNESYDIFTKSYKQFKNKNFSDNQLKILKKYAQKNKIIFFATPGDIPSLKRVIKLKFCIIKVSSGLSNNYPLIREAIKSKIPLFISTGMPLPLSSTDIPPFFNITTYIASQCPAIASSIELSTTSQTR